MIELWIGIRLQVSRGTQAWVESFYSSQSRLDDPRLYPTFYLRKAMPENIKDKVYPVTSDEYREADGAECPYCGSEDIVGATIQIGSGDAYQLMSCSSCEKKWYDLYTLTGYEPAGG